MEHKFKAGDRVKVRDGHESYYALEDATGVFERYDSSGGAWFCPDEQYIVEDVTFVCINAAGLEMDDREYNKPLVEVVAVKTEEALPVTPEYTGGSSSYYKVEVSNPVSNGDPYTVECQDVIEALDMSFSEGNIFKAVWRICAAKKGKAKKGYEDSVYDLEKIIFFAQRELQIEKMKRGQ